MKRLTLVVGLALLISGCAALNPRTVRELTQKETAAFAALSERLKENRPNVKKTSTGIGDLGARWAEQEFLLELDLAKAKRLDSMTAPWAAPSENLRETQMAVILYHLYQVEMAEQKVLDARRAERQAAAGEILATYDRLTRLIEGASKNLKVVLEYLNQPKGAQISSFARTFLGEVSAFRQTLQASQNPRLQALASEIARHEQSAEKATENAERALDAIMKLQKGGS